MTTQQIQHLLHKYRTSKLNQEEELALERAIALGLIQIEDLEDLHQYAIKLKTFMNTDVSTSMQTAYNDMMIIEKSKPKLQWVVSLEVFLSYFMPRSPIGSLALSILMLLLGISLGSYFFSDKTSDQHEEVIALSDKVIEMQEMLMLGLIENESPTDRLKAVNMTQEIPEASEAVTQALFKTLNTDENVNVRLEALNALYSYANDAEVREGLVQSISQQDTPFMQIALAEVMVALQEKKSVRALQELLNQREIPEVIRQKIEEKIQVLM